MTFSIRTVLLAISALSIAAPTLAQLSPGTSGISSAPRSATEREYWALVRSMGDCLADYKTEQSIAFLEAPISSRAENKAFDKLFGRSRNMCMKDFVSASFRRAHVRGAIAEALYRRNMRDLGDEFMPAINAPEKIGSIHDFARCHIASNFAQTRDFLGETKLNTDSELKYLQRMAPDFSTCLPKDREVTLKPINVRMSLAEAMYHATKPVAAAPHKDQGDA